MIQKFSVQNYRNVSIDDIEFCKLNIFIGPNNSGKTNLIKALSFLSNMVKAKPELGSTAFYQQLMNNGWNRTLNFDSKERHISFSWTFKTNEFPDKPYKYDLKMHIGDSSDRRDFYIIEESLGYAKALLRDKKAAYNFYTCHKDAPNMGWFSVDNDEQKRVKLEVSSNEAAFLQMDKLRDLNEDFDSKYRKIYSDNMKILLNYLNEFYNYSSADFVLDRIKKPVESKSEDIYLNHEGTNLANLLLHWSENEYETFTNYRNMISPLFGGKNTVDLQVNIISGTTDIRVSIGKDGKKYYLDDLSDGTIKAMLLAALLVNRKNKMSVCAIDEPEMNLHPEWQSRFCEWLCASNASEQLFISTHSPEVLDAITDAFMNDECKIFILSEQGGIRELEKNRVEHAIEDGFNIGDLYRAKAIEIGGWPI